MTPREVAIHTCKEQIRYAANYAGLNWSEDDLVCVHDDSIGDIVFLRRFNPHEAIGDYYIDGGFADEDSIEMVDDDGDVVMRDGKSVMEWTKTLWIEFPASGLPRVVCVAPWLVRIVSLDGTIVGETNRHNIPQSFRVASWDTTHNALEAMSAGAVAGAIGCACQCNDG